MSQYIQSLSYIHLKRKLGKKGKRYWKEISCIHRYMNLRLMFSWGFLVDDWQFLMCVAQIWIYKRCWRKHIVGGSGQMRSMLFSVTIDTSQSTSSQWTYPKVIIFSIAFFLISFFLFFFGSSVKFWTWILLVNGICNVNLDKSLVRLLFVHIWQVARLCCSTVRCWGTSERMVITGKRKRMERQLRKLMNT